MSRNRWSNHVAPIVTRLAECLTPASQLRDRSGSRSALPVENAVLNDSKNVGALKAVPALKRTDPPRQARQAKPARAVRNAPKVSLSSYRAPAVIDSGPCSESHWPYTALFRRSSTKRL